jgi:hypothetical protein
VRSTDAAVRRPAPPPLERTLITSLNAASVALAVVGIALAIRHRSRRGVAAAGRGRPAGTDRRADALARRLRRRRRHRILTGAADGEKYTAGWDLGTG